MSQNEQSPNKNAEKVQESGQKAQLNLPASNDKLLSPFSSKVSSLSKKSHSSPGTQKLYINSNIFEKPDDAKNFPFVFEKHNLK